MANFAQAMRAHGRALRLKGSVTLPGGIVRALGGGDIRALTISEGSEQGLLPGQVLSASCRLTLDNSDGRWLEGGAMRGLAPLRGAEFAIEIGVLIGGAYEYAPLGRYICDDAAHDENGATMELSCYDSIYFTTAGAFADASTYPRTLRELWIAAAAGAGYAFSGSVPNGDGVISAAPEWGEISVREAMGYIAAAAGCFVRIDRQGVLRLVPLKSADAAVDITPAIYMSRTRRDGAFGPINRLRVQTVNARGDGDSEPYELVRGQAGAEGAREFSVAGNPLFITGGAQTAALAQGMYGAVSGLTYTDCRFTWRGDPALLPGARVRLIGRDGAAQVHMLSRQTLRFDGGFAAECASGVPNASGGTTRILMPGGGVDAGRLVGVVYGGNIAANAVSASKIAAGAISTDKLAAGAVTALKIAAEAIDATKIKARAVQASHIEAGAVETEKLAANAVTAEKIAAGAVDAAQIKAGAVQATHIEAGAVTADKLVAGLITAQSGIIEDGAIGTVQIADGSITDAKIVGLTAGKITAGTIDASNINVVNLNADNLTVGTINGARIPVLGREKVADGAISGAKIDENAITAGKIVSGAVTTDKLAANAVTTNKILANAVTAGKIDVEGLFAAQATINAISTMTVASVESGSALILNKDRIAMETPLVSIIATGAEEGQQVVRIDADGLYAERVASPTVARRMPGGVYTVYNNADFDTLADAFDALEGATLDGDVVLKLGRDDAGGTLRAVRGGRVIITSGNLIYRHAKRVQNAEFAVSGSYGYRVNCPAGGAWSRAIIEVGRVGDLGLAGKDVTIKVGTITNSGATFVGASLYLLDADYQSNELHLQTLNFSDEEKTARVPADTDDDRMLCVMLQLSRGAAAAAGSYIIYDGLRVEIGGSVYGWATAQYKIADFEAVNCDRVTLSRLTLPAGVRLRAGRATITRCELYGQIGVLADQAQVRMSDNAGACAKAVKAMGGMVHVTGAAPGGAYEGWLIDTSTAQISGSGSAGNEQTKTLTANATGTYTGSWWSGDRSVRQGYTVSNGRIRGGMWWDFGAIPSGAPVMEMQLTIKRMAGFGQGGKVTAKVYGTSSNARSGQPALTTAGFALGEIGEGQTRTWDLPVAIRTGLANGTLKGIVLYADDTGTMSGKTYSANYARFEGTDGSGPRLAVRYTQS
ncbi:MAG: hypothetical protein ACOYI5_06095 [Christensenellales bacterium]